MLYIRSVLIALSLVVLSGCASQSLVRPAQDALTLGKSKSVDVISVVGMPPTVKKDDVPVNGEKITVMTYREFRGAKFWGMIAPQRTLTYSFHNDVLVGEEANSSFDEDSTEWNTGKVGQIVKGKSTKGDVLAVMGKPSGEFIYPLNKDKSGKSIVYAYTVTHHAGVFSPTSNYILVVSLDDKDVVTGVSYRKDGQEQIN